MEATYDKSRDTELLNQACGCVVFRRHSNILDEDRVFIQFCPKHKAAPDMYEALKKIADEGTRCLLTEQPNKPLRDVYNIGEVDRIARQAIAKVEGRE